MWVSPKASEQLAPSQVPTRTLTGGYFHSWLRQAKIESMTKRHLTRHAHKTKRPNPAPRHRRQRDTFDQSEAYELNDPKHPDYLANLLAKHEAREELPA